MFPWLDSDVKSAEGEKQRVRMLSQTPRYHWLGAYSTNALYSGHIFVRFNDLEDVFT